MRTTPFTRPTIIAAVEFLERHSQARFNQMVLRLELENDISSDTNLSVAKKCDMLGRIVVRQLKYFQFQTPLGHLGQAIEAHTRGDWAAANGRFR